MKIANNAREAARGLSCNLSLQGEYYVALVQFEPTRQVRGASKASSRSVFSIITHHFSSGPIWDFASSEERGQWKVQSDLSMRCAQKVRALILSAKCSIICHFQFLYEIPKQSTLINIYPPWRKNTHRLWSFSEGDKKTTSL